MTVENKYIIISGIVLGAFLLICFLTLYLPLIINTIKKRKTYCEKNSKTVDGALNILQSKCTAIEKAEAFVFLLCISYVLVHTMINNGQKYDDKIQTKLFIKSLRPNIIEKINSLGEK